MTIRVMAIMEMTGTTGFFAAFGAAVPMQAIGEKLATYL